MISPYYTKPNFEKFQMASIFLIAIDANIDYLMNGRVTNFSIGDRTLYDEKVGESDMKWKEVLYGIIKQYGLDKDDGRGLHAFVYPLLEEFQNGSQSKV